MQWVRAVLMHRCRLSGHRPTAACQHGSGTGTTHGVNKVTAVKEHMWWYSRKCTRHGHPLVCGRQNLYSKGSLVDASKFGVFAFLVTGGRS
jgi:hypothetical protein